MVKKTLLQYSNFLLAVLLCVSVHSALQAQNLPFSPDHYISYDVVQEPPGFVPVSVILQDQFIQASTFNFKVIKAIKILNPAKKIHANQTFNIQNTNLHYTAFQIQTISPINITKKVNVTNQFGNFTLESFVPDRILVPTRKIHLGADRIADLQAQNGLGAAPPATNIPAGDHYLCYAITAQLSQNPGAVALQDQFRTRTIDALVPKHLCNPVAKTHKGKLSPILNNDSSNHLMCFALPKLTILNKRVGYLNQFGGKTLRVTNDDELCVPSTKVEVTSCGFSDGECGGSCPDGEFCGDIGDNLCECLQFE
jgi:hypothetical protein